MKKLSFFSVNGCKRLYFLIICNTNRILFLFGDNLISSA